MVSTQAFILARAQQGSLILNPQTRHCVEWYLISVAHLKGQQTA